MNEKQTGSSAKKALGIVLFVLGFVVALGIGWAVFPDLIYSQKTQPINFSHAAHQDNDCESCHSFRPDGTYSGIPRIDKCKECHESMQGESEAEKTLVEQYIQNDREVAWNVYAWQPDNVFFSHAPHKGQGLECTHCHRDVAKEEKLPRFRQNIITGYSKSTMKMVECEKCHAEKNTSNSCEICHK